MDKNTGMIYTHRTSMGDILTGGHNNYRCCISHNHGVHFSLLYTRCKSGIHQLSVLIQSCSCFLTEINSHRYTCGYRESQRRRRRNNLFFVVGYHMYPMLIICQQNANTLNAYLKNRDSIGSVSDKEVILNSFFYFFFR